MIADKLILQTSNWQDFTNKLKDVSKKRGMRHMGNVYERLVQLYLQTNPKYKSILKNVWLLNEVSPSLKEKLNLPDADEGIDLIAVTNDNEYWAIQAKYRSNPNETLTMGGFGGLSTFSSLAFHTCKNISHGLVCTTTSNPPKKLNLLGNVGFETYDSWIGLDDFNGEGWQLIKSQAKGKIVVPKPFTPRPHSKKAIAKAYEHFVKKKNARGKLIMPCGTGKTITGFWIAQKLNAKNILIAVPSLALLKQTLEVWTREFLLYNMKPDWICVCSDESAGSLEQDDFVAHTYDLGVECTTNQKDIVSFLKQKSNMKVVFTTYQSGKVTGLASNKVKFTYDLGILDEAHKTVGHGKKMMAYLLHQSNIKIKHRLNMTATERIFSGDKDEYLSMDDPRDYGEVFYQLSFKEAIESRPPIICDYKIITLDVRDYEIGELWRKNKYIEVKRHFKDITAREFAVALALRKAVKQLGIKKALSFHSSINRAKRFGEQQELITKVYKEYGKINAFHVSGNIPTGERANLLRQFGKTQKGLMTNARCLTEGVDIPAIDCVCFTDPKRSRIDIVQAAGRALRLSKGKKYGYILVPIYIPKSEDKDEAVKKSGFDEIISTVGALSIQDERIVEQLRGISEGIKPKGGGGPIDGVTKLVKTIKINPKDFEEAVQLEVWKKIARTNFKPFEEARKYSKSLELKSGEEWKKFAKSKNRPFDIPMNPIGVYKNKGWISMGDWLGTGRIAASLRQYKTYEEAKKFAISLKIKTANEWGKLSRNKKFPIDIPKKPDRIYEKQDKWISWGDFLETGRRAGKYRKFKDARIYAHNLNLKIGKEWSKFAKSKNRPFDIPMNPGGVYKNKGWISMGDWLGTGRIANYNKKWASYKDAKKYISKFQFNGIGEYRKWASTNKRPMDIPHDVKRVYTKQKTWISWEDFFSSNYIHPKEFIPFKECKKFVQSKKISSKANWFKYWKKNKKKFMYKKIPLNPDQVYKNEWRGLKDFFGPSYEGIREYLNYDEAKKIVRKKKIKYTLEYTRIWKQEFKSLNIPYRPKRYYKNKGWKGWKDFYGDSYLGDSYARK